MDNFRLEAKDFILKNEYLSREKKEIFFDALGKEKISLESLENEVVEKIIQLENKAIENENEVIEKIIEQEEEKAEERRRKGSSAISNYRSPVVRTNNVEDTLGFDSWIPKISKEGMEEAKDEIKKFICSDFVDTIYAIKDAGVDIYNRIFGEVMAKVGAAIIAGIFIPAKIVMTPQLALLAIIFITFEFVENKREKICID